jgi:Myb DNA-binding like
MGPVGTLSNDRRRPQHWDANNDSKIFCDALRQVGADVNLMRSYFNDRRNRCQLKRKYQTELIKNPELGRPRIASHLQEERTGASSHACLFFLLLAFLDASSGIPIGRSVSLHQSLRVLPFADWTVFQGTPEDVAVVPCPTTAPPAAPEEGGADAAATAAAAEDEIEPNERVDAAHVARVAAALGAGDGAGAGTSVQFVFPVSR